VYTPKGDRAWGIIEGLKAIVADKLRAKSSALATQAQKSSQQRALPQAQGSAAQQQISSSSSSPGSGPTRSIRMVRS
jgi:hypothetical protein